MPRPDAWEVLYLRVIGRLYPDGRLRLRPCYLTDEAPWSDRAGERDGPLAAELLDEGGRAIGSFPLRVYPVCAFGPGGSTRAVRAWVPFHPDTRAVRFTLDGRVVHELRRAERPPEIHLTWEPRERLEGRHRVSWDAHAPEGARLQFFLRYSHDGGRRWQRVGWRTEAREALLDLDELPGGERCLVAVVATDGLDTAIVRSAPFAVAVKPCVAFILQPVDGTVFRPGEPVHLSGQGYWMEEARPEHRALRWRADLQRDLGEGRTLTVTDLPPGEHTITLVAGREPREGTASVTIVVAGEGTDRVESPTG